MMWFWLTVYAVIATSNGLIRVPLTFYNYLEYYGPIAIGTPQQHFNVIFDSNVQGLFVISDKCSTRDNPPKFHSSQSYTYKNLIESDRMPYGSGMTNGSISTDVVSIRNQRLENQKFMEVCSEKGTPFINRLCDGAFGLNHIKVVMSNHSRSIIVNMVNQGLIEDYVFSVYIKRVNGYPVVGEITFGGSIDHYHARPFTYLPIITTYSWTLKVNTIQIGVAKFCQAGCKVHLSTTTAGIIGPAAQIRFINQKLGGHTINSDGYYQVNCTTVQHLPQIFFIFRAQIFSLSSRDYIIKKQTPTSVHCLSSFKYSHNEDEWVIGNVFMSRYYTKFNLKENSIGLALKSKLFVS